MKAILPIAGDSYLFDKAGLAKITVPLMAIGGTADTGTPFDLGGRTGLHQRIQRTQIAGCLRWRRTLSPGLLRRHALVVQNALLWVGLLRSRLGQGQITAT